MGEIGLSVITLAELRYGAGKSSQPRKNHEALDQFISPLRVAPFDQPATVAYHALILDARLVTNNEREFSQVPGLRVENWV